ncbi:hypothetical protein CWI36_1570p0010 [Hamiltosporidium magnivora]|uniref:Leucine rich repeat protein n=1 Tax=Hamiltosporidium magnivora TaxID=148818 RepID=A0A4Q9L008_9MICR|nr:hypothetical protein CWI36_1570p0010 [Hamiltosporidium magnivora]
MKFNLCFHLITLLYKPLIFVYIDPSSERDIMFNVVNENEESYMDSINNELELEGPCQIKRDETNENDEKKCNERMYVRDSNRQYEEYCIEFIERIGLKFDIFEKFNNMNNNIEIYLCHHIKKSNFLIFYKFIISYYFPVHKMTIDKFYTILYFLEYFRIEYDNKLRNVIKIIWFSLVKSDEMNNFNIEKVSFHFSKQINFSHALLKKISKGYLKLLNNGKDLKFSFFITEYECYVSIMYNGIFSEDRKHMLVINDKFHTFFNKKVNMNHKSQCLFLMFLNTLDIKYLHIHGLNRENPKSFCFILDNLKKKIDEIVFFECYISDDVIYSLNANLSLVNLKKMVFIESKFDTVFIFTEHLSDIEEFIFYEKHYYGRNKLPEIQEGDLNIAKFIIQNLKLIHSQHSTEEYFKENENIPKENKDFYLKLLKKEKFGNKVKIIEYFRCKNYNLEVKCFYEYKGCFNNISITFKNLNENQFFTTENTILEDNIESIKISYSAIKSGFLKDIFNIKGLERFEIMNSDIFIENKIFINESIKYFRFIPNNSDSLCSFCSFFKLIDMMIGLQEIYFYKTNFIKLNRSVNQIFYTTELYLLDINEMINFLKHSKENEKFDFEATSKDEENLKLSSIIVKFLFQNYDISSIRILSIRDLCINNSNVKAFSNFLNLKELNLFEINLQNMSFSELFCANQEYKIQIMKLIEINISEKDFIFIANLKKIEYIRLWSCDILKNTYSCLQMYFYNEFYIELEYDIQDDYLTEETINYIKEKFKTKYIVITDS